MPDGSRRLLLDDIATRVPAPPGDDCVLIAVHGVDGAGKTVFADSSLLAGLADASFELRDLHERISGGRPMTVTCHRFALVAELP